MQNRIELPDFLTGVSVGNSSNTEYSAQVTDVKSVTHSSVSGLSARAVAASALLRSS